MRTIFYGPADWLVDRTNARQRRAINFWFLVAWLVPGIPVWIALRSSLWFVGFMSIWAIWTSHWGSLAAETPVEEES